MKEENNTIKSRNTFTITDLPLNKQALNGRWVYKKKEINNNYINPNWIINTKKTSYYKAK